MAKKPKARDVVDALIAMLPPAGGEFDPVQRENWLRMMGMGFDLRYGPAGQEVAIPKLVLKGTPAAAKPAEAPPVLAPHTAYGADYYVDPDGFVRCDHDKVDGLPIPSPGRRVSADEIEGDESIYDYRGAARDRATVVWADDTVGARPGMTFCGPG